MQSIRLLRSRGRVFERDFTLALRSGAIFLLLMVPLTYPEQIAGVAINIQAVYVWLPLWYMSTLRNSLGGWIQIAVHALQGTLAAVLVILALNATSTVTRGEKGSFQWKWLAIVFVLAYGVGWSRADKDLKKFFFGTLSPLLVMCLGADGPDSSSKPGFFKAQETALIYEEHINWTSIIFCYVYLTLVALSLSAVTLLLRGRAWLASSELTEEVAMIALETWRSLKLLLKYFSCRPADFDLDALGQHLQVRKTASLHLELVISKGNSKFVLHEYEQRKISLQVSKLQQGSQLLAAENLAICNEVNLSRGSYGHPNVCARPCILFLRDKCYKADKCGFCHLIHESRPPTLDKQQRDYLKELSKVTFLKMLLPFVRKRVEGTELDVAVVLQLMQAEISLRSPRSPEAPDVYCPRKIRHVLERMSVAGLVSTASTILPQDRLPKLMKNELERLRKAIRAFDLDTLG
eukprot:s3694_g2.t4